MNNIIILNLILYRLSEGSRQGNYIVKAQLDTKKGQVKSVKKHREEILEDIIRFIKSKKLISDIIIAGDLNKKITSPPIRQFFIQNGLYDIHGIIN